MDRLARSIHNAGEIADGAADANFSSKQVPGVKTADRVDSQIAVFVDVPDQETDLIHVRRQHDSHGFGFRISVVAARSAKANQRAHRIDGDLIKQIVCRDIVLNHFTNTVFAARN